MQQSLNLLHEYLKSRYRTQLDLLLTNAEAKSSIEPTWLWQDERLQTIASEVEASGAAVLDPNLGLCLYFQTFQSNTDIKAQISKALRIRSQLLPSRNIATEEIDKLGEWKVAVHWLVDRANFDNWLETVANLRQSTTYFEEITVDAIVSSDNDWQKAFTDHGVPRLLFNTRMVLAKRREDEALKWASADLHILEKLREVPRLLATTDQDVAAQISNVLNTHVSSSPTSDEKIPLSLTRVEINNFRNIRQLSLNFGSEQSVEAIVVQGPNGSGKSAFSEAISIACTGVSARYLDFIDDANEAPHNKSDKYLAKYLAPLSNDGTPKIAINNEGLKPVKLADPTEAPALIEQLSGSFLTADSSNGFIKTRAKDLGAQIAGSYSELAGSILDLIEKRLGTAEAKRAELNRALGLRANVSREETARAKIASNHLSSIAAIQSSVVGWISSWNRTTSRWESSFRELSERVRNWSEGADARSELVGLTPRVSERLLLVSSQLNEYESVLRAVRSLSAEVQNASKSLPAGAEQMVAAWARWLRTERTSHKTDDLTSIRLADLRSRLAKLTADGTAARDQLAQIESVQIWMKQHAQSDHPNECPICSSDLTSRGGLQKAIEETADATSRRIEQLRVEYADTKKELDTVASTAELNTPPLNTEDANSLETSISSLLGHSFSLDELHSESVEERIVHLLSLASRPAPTVPSENVEPEILAKNISQQIGSKLEEFRSVSEEPEKWRRVLKLVVGQLTSAVAEHLPNTVEALWIELAKNMMPAPWQYPGKAKFAIDQKGAQTEIRVVLSAENQSPLAAHILNGAEVQNLGLAWFMTRYLTHGRFSFSFLMLDDPAHYMDQPTFRQFCRTLETIKRLHANHRLPLTLVLLLHHDDRH